MVREAGFEDVAEDARIGTALGTISLLLSQQQPVTVLDIRPFSEWSEWSIPGSLHLDAYEALKVGRASALDTVELSAGGLVVAVCGAGKTSQLAAERLRHSEQKWRQPHACQAEHQQVVRRVRQRKPQNWHRAQLSR